MLIKPADKNVFSFLRDVRAIIKESKTAKTDELILRLNARIRGWANYYRHAVSKKIFAYVDHCIFQALSRWMKRRHPNKSAKWLKDKYFRRHKLRNWVFSTKIRSKDGETKYLDLLLASSVKIKRHIKIKGEANPFNRVYKDYFEKRDKRSKVSPRDAGRDERYLPIF